MLALGVWLGNQCSLFPMVLRTWHIVVCIRCWCWSWLTWCLSGCTWGLWIVVSRTLLLVLFLLLSWDQILQVLLLLFLLFTWAVGMLDLVFPCMLWICISILQTLNSSSYVGGFSFSLCTAASARLSVSLLLELPLLVVHTSLPSCWKSPTLL